MNQLKYIHTHITEHVINEKKQTNSFYSFFNSMHDNLQFTMDKQINYKLPFLDMLVHCNDSKISLSIFSKPSNNGLGISFFQFLSLCLQIKCN